MPSDRNDLFASYRGIDAADETDTDAKFEKGKPADPTVNMSPEDKDKWEKSKDENKDKFKGAGTTSKTAYYTVVVPPGATKWQSPRDTLTRGAFDTKREAEAWAKKNVPDEAWKVEEIEDVLPTKVAAAQEATVQEAAVQAAAGEYSRHRTTWASTEFTAGSGASNAKYLDSLSPQQKAKILKAVAGHYGVSVSEIEGELKHRDAEDLYEYLAFDHDTAMQVYRDFKRMRLASDKTAAPSGLYGFTRKTQTDVEASVRKLQRQANKVARAIWQKDERVASFLTTHSKRASSAPARLLLSALKGMGPKVASTTRLALDSDQEVLYDALMLIAENDGAAYKTNDARKAVENAYEVYRRSQTDNLRDDFRAVKNVLEKDLAKAWVNTRKYAGSDARVFSLAIGVSPDDAKDAVRDAQRYLGGDYEVYRTHTIGDVQVVNVKPRHMAEGDWFEGFGALFNHFINHMKTKGYRPDVRGSMYMNREFIQGMKKHNGRMASELKLEVVAEDMGKTAASEFGLYGYRSRTATLGLNACAQMREAAGQIAYDLHNRRQANYALITGFLKEHSKTSKCRYSKLLLASYPDAPPAVKAAAAKVAAALPRKGQKVQVMQPSEFLRVHDARQVKVDAGTVGVVVGVLEAGSPSSAMLDQLGAGAYGDDELVIKFPRVGEVRVQPYSFQKFTGYEHAQIERVASEHVASTPAGVDEWLAWE